MTIPDPARHRAPRRTPPPPRGRRIAERSKPRYGRVSALAGALVVTAIAVGGAAGLVPTHSSYAATGTLSSKVVTPTVSPSATPSATQVTPEPEPETSPDPTAQPAFNLAPANSGQGRRIVFDQSEQRVWLISSADQVERTYLVSGSLTDNLHPGTYSVSSRSRWAVGIGESGVMQYMVRFAEGVNAPIGFHSIPTHLGQPLQTLKQLGTPQSHGCIRQALPDALALWNYAPDGTKVVVTA